ncbi:MAG: 2-succinyl-6-hydroxy-2,4-cyclohexadiene-1-carboxylate synthase [Syntrophus sp. SKADARSKE-3]|nr:2-succinyl-6-hydroxy-2,4-cyclohexadiene-1-carboxylate synthase [Syntrophus sp. SKADARSKE-3]
MSVLSCTDYSVFDRPEILRYLFYPRPEWNISVTGGQGIPLTMPISEDVIIGGQFHESARDAANILFFHGNGEVVTDYSDIAHFYQEKGINFIPVDYRGYGRSTGYPTVTFMMKDCHTIFSFVKKFLQKQGYTGPLVIMGRSLGSASALELAVSYPDEIDGLIIESGFAFIGPLLAIMGINMMSMGITEDMGFRNLDKVRGYDKPSLFIHSQYDHIIAHSEGVSLYEASPARIKKFLTIANANHNNIFFAGMNEYMNAISWLVKQIEKGDE